MVRLTARRCGSPGMVGVRIRSQKQRRNDTGDMIGNRKRRDTAPRIEGLNCSVRVLSEI
jgi:hypothetical protein